MSITNILVAYNGLPGAEAALSGALSLQRFFGAHLTGLYAHGGSSLSHHLKPWMPATVQDALMDVETRTATELAARFAATCAAVPEEKRHWIDSGVAARDAVSSYARLYDLTILGMHEAAVEYGQSHVEIYPDRVAFDSGRPVLIVPPDYRGDIVNSKAVVAWDGGRAAARALADAMQLLEAESEVVIASVGRSPLEGALPGIDVRTVLERHNANVTVVELPRDRRSVADILVEYCDECGAGLLVMGAYEHSRLREDFMGGVTHDVALRAKAPVLMSH